MDVVTFSIYYPDCSFCLFDMLINVFLWFKFWCSNNLILTKHIKQHIETFLIINAEHGVFLLIVYYFISIYKDKLNLLELDNYLFINYGSRLAFSGRYQLGVVLFYRIFLVLQVSIPNYLYMQS